MAQTITVTQSVDELIFDVQNKAYLTGRSREAEGAKTYEASSNMQASDDQEDIEQIKRSLNNAYTGLKSILGEYLVSTATSSSNAFDTNLTTGGTLTLTFNMPGNFNPASVDAIGSNIHAYLVDTALAEWFTITNKADAADYVEHAKLSLEIVKRALYRRTRPSRT